MILAAQDQALPTKYHKIRIEKQRGDPACRLCGEHEETNIQTDKVIDARRPDIVVTKKDRRESCSWIIDIAIPGDLRVRGKEIEKREKYKDLAMEIKRL